MSLSQVLEALSDFSFEERQILIRRVFELDDPPLSDADEALIESRLAAHKSDPTSSLPLETLKERLRSRTKR
jgi:putative addiction module component (TIGR02574 family)